jgi:glycosyltransferase involved in cell wall biosynthesis
MMAPPIDAHAAFSLPARAPLVGNVAALVPHKGQRYLIHAAALVRHDVPDVRFLIVGEGELYASLARQVRQLHLDQHVILTGFRTDVVSLHKSFDLFVMSSVTEGLGTSLLDAMACERPVVATRAGGMPELVVDGETGVLVPVRDAQALAVGIVRLLRDDSLRRRMGRAGCERVRTAFSAERMIDGTIAVYERLLAARSSGTDRAEDRSRLAAGV